jgi:hypothetical protein
VAPAFSGAFQEDPLDNIVMRSITVGLLLLASIGLVTPAATAVAEPPPTRTLTVDGTGVTRYPAFDPAITRYGVRTTAGTNGSITVNASTTDPDGTVTIDGRPAPVGADVAVDDLTAGDEVTVRISDDGGATSYALVYLPAGFPALTATSSGEGPADGFTFLTLNSGSSSFETAVDENGVPVYVRSGATASSDLQRQPDGRYSVARATAPGSGDYEVWALDDAFEGTDSYQTVAPATSTDFHDSVFSPDGQVLLMTYQGGTIDDEAVFDSIIQELAPDGSAAFTWNSADHIPLEDGLVGHLDSGFDYSHLNSLQYLPDGDILASFRNTSQVMKIARTAHDGFQPGDVVWRIGGVSGDFTFVDDPYGGFCAQHTARILANGHLLVWDNGAFFQPGNGFTPQTGDICPNPAGPDEPRVGRGFSRAAEYALDLDAMTATLVWQSDDDEGYTPFAGSAQRLPGGHTMLGRVGGGTTEVDGDADVVWSLQAGGGFTSYRAQKFDAPDTVDPTVDLAVPADGATYARDQVLDVDVRCTDRGGSTLQTCDRPASVDTSTPGTHTFTVTGTDGAGNTTEVTHTYEVAVGPHQPDGVIRRQARGPWIGNLRYNTDGAGQTVVLTGRPTRVLNALVRFQDDGIEADTFTIRGAGNTGSFRVRYFRGSQDVSAAVKAGTYTTPELQPGRYAPLRVEILVKRIAAAGAEQRIRVTATSVAEHGRADTVVAVARASG